MGAGEGGARTITYCVIPQDLARALHEPLRKHFRDDPWTEVVVEQRRADRRRPRDRRTEAAVPPDEDLRRIRNTAGRRIADRRAPTLPVSGAPLPRRAQRHAGRIVFVERVLPPSVQTEDVDTARLVTRIQAGERDLYSELYLRYFERVYAYVKLVLRDPHAAEDIAQQVFMRVLQVLPRYEYRGSPFRVWLFVIVRNETRDELRRRQRMEPMTDDDLQSRNDCETVGDLPGGDWINDRELMMFVERLPLAHRQVLVLRFMVDLPVRDVARLLDRSEVDVRAIQHRALTNLRQRLAAVGRASGTQRGRAPTRRVFRPAQVLRGRRFALLRS